MEIQCAIVDAVLCAERKEEKGRASRASTACARAHRGCDTSAMLMKISSAGVAVQRRAQALLVEVVADETNAASENEQPIQGTNLDVLIRLLRRESARVAQQVHEAHSDTAVHVQDELQIDHRQHTAKA